MMIMIDIELHPELGLSHLPRSFVDQHLQG